jgi:hypothetical protein
VFERRGYREPLVPIHGIQQGASWRLNRGEE